MQTVAMGMAFTYINVSIWTQRGLVSTDGSPVVHGKSIELNQVMQLPEELAIVICAAHESDKTLVAWKQRRTLVFELECALETCLGLLIEAQINVPKLVGTKWDNYNSHSR